MNTTFFEIIKKARTDKGETQSQTAEQMGVSLRQYQRWEKDTIPNPGHLVTLSKHLGVNLLATLSVATGQEWNEAVEISEPVGTYTNKQEKEFIELGDGRYIMHTPLIQHKAYNGYLTGWGDPEYIEELPTHPIIVDKPHMGTYRSFESKGDSMDDGTSRAIENKDILTGRKIERSHWKNKLHLGKYKEYVIVTFKKGIITKNIVDHNTSEHTIKCHSYNPDKKLYPDFTLDLNEVMEIYNIVQITKRR